MNRSIAAVHEGIATGCVATGLSKLSERNERVASHE